MLVSSLFLSFPFLFSLFSLLPLSYSSLFFPSSLLGIYFQAEIQGHPVTWVVPHSTSGSYKAPQDVDFKIMTTFVEFYVTLMGFVNYKLWVQCQCEMSGSLRCIHDDMYIIYVCETSSLSTTEFTIPLRTIILQDAWMYFSRSIFTMALFFNTASWRAGIFFWVLFM